MLKHCSYIYLSASIHDVHQTRCDDFYLLQQKKKQKTLAKIKQLTEEEDSTRVVKQKGKSKGKSQKGNQTKGGKDVPAKKSRSKKSAKQSEVTTKCNILPYFTVRK